MLILAHQETSVVSITRGRPANQHGSIFVLRSEVELPATPAEVFPFFADARNLDAITPAFLRFRVLTPGPIQMRVGTRIDYSLRVHGFPIRWTSEITVWGPPKCFVDVQIRGPYRRWHHVHRFEDLGTSTRVIDDVEYACPGGRLLHELFVKRDLVRIFEYRRAVLAKIFPSRAAQGLRCDV
jgi:hypothetical protein